MASEEAISAGLTVVSVEVFQRTRKMFGFSMGRDERPVLEKDSDLYLLEFTPDTRHQFRMINNPLEDVPEEADGQMRFYRVRKHPHLCSFSFPSIKEEAGHGWDYSLEGCLEVTRGVDLLKAIGEAYAQPKSPLTVAVLSAWLAEQIRSWVHDAVASHSLTELRDKEALPGEWWNAHLKYRLEEYGLQLRVDRQAWTSASAEAAEAEERRKEHFQRVKRQREEEREAELQEIRSNQAYEDEKNRIEADATLSEAQRNHQLEVLRLKHQTETEALKAELEKIRRRTELETGEHALRMARLRQNEDMLRHVKHCPQCDRPLLNGEVLDKTLNLCEWCAEEYRNEEMDREEIVPLRLCISGPGADATVFLFARRTLQWGRCRQKDLYSHLSKHPQGDVQDYEIRENDIVLRVMEGDASGRVRSHRERSLAISGVHGALTVLPGRKKETIKVVDFSSSGGYLKKHRLPRGKWQPCPDNAQITVGPASTATLPGLGLSVRVFRDPDNEKRVQSVKLERDDFLGEKHHSYVMVVREALLGSGPDNPLLFPRNGEGAVAPHPWGRIYVARNGFMFERSPGNNFVSDGDQTNSPVLLEPGVEVRCGDYVIEVNAAGERDFYEV